LKIFAPTDVGNLKIPNFLTGGGRQMPEKNKLALRKTVHEQDDGTIFAICCTGTSTKDSLLSWIRLLEQDGNPDLAEIPVLFKFRSPIAHQLVPIDPSPSRQSVEEINR
jgi:evolutionarily conserved signaling intermediate in Toll pathway